MQLKTEVKTIKFASKPENITIVEKFIDDLSGEVIERTRTRGQHE